MREIKVTKDFINSKNTSVLYESGNTKVLITVSISDRLPRWLENSDSGWVTAEYSVCFLDHLVAGCRENHMKVEDLKRSQD